MKDENNDLRARTKEFAIRVIRMYSALPKSAEAQVLGKQVLRQVVEKRYEEAGMRGASERKSEAYNLYVERMSERQHRRPAP